MFNKIVFDDVNECNKIKFNSKKIYALDTENTNNNNIESITYCTSLIEVGAKTDKTELIKNGGDIVNIFTHPLKFWDYILKDGYEQTEIYVFNADYDVENLLPFLIQIYPQLKEYQYQYKINVYDFYEKDGYKKNEPYTYEFIKSKNSIIGLILTLGLIKETKTKKVYKQIKIYDLAKRTVGNLASNVKAYLGIEMSKDGLDYNIFRDYGHKDYTEEELKYIWEDTYYLKELVYNFLTEQNYIKLTTGSNALNNYKETLFNEFKDNYNNIGHINYKLYNGYFKSKQSRIQFLINNKNRLNDKQLKELDNYYNKLNEYDNIDTYFLNQCKKQELFEYIFPPLDYNIFNNCFLSYKGGITRYNKPCKEGKWLNEEGYSFDINSSYPTSMRFKELPYGKGVIKKGQGKFKKGKLFIQQFTVNGFYIKDNYEPIIQLQKNKYGNSDTWVKNYNKPITLWLTSVELEYFLNAYNISNIEYINYIEFNSKVGLFNTFIDENYKIKQTNTGAIKEKAKLNLNSLYGKFGQNTTTELRTTSYNAEENRIDEVIERDNFGENKLVSMSQVYLPVAVFTTAYSRLKLINILNNANNEKGVKWVYCDTDSIYMIGNKESCVNALKDEYDVNNSGDLGLWKLEKNFIGINIIGIKKYICKIKEDNFIKYKVTLSGINKKYFQLFESDLSKDENIIDIINTDNLNLINSNNYYIKRDSLSQDFPYVYKDKNCTERIIGAYKSIRKLKVKNGVILSDGVYCIKGGK